ncbi:MAG: TetR/AcrR family transcriptional regulator, partial [Steroidobacteraceae bacterium]
ARAFAARGYHNTSLDDLAATLNVTKPTIYSYVDSKEELLFECFRQGVDQILAGFREAETRGGTARDRLMTVARHYAIAVTGDFGWCMVRLEEEDLEKSFSAKIKTLKSEVDQGLRKLIRQGVADGSIRASDPKMAAFALAGALNWIAHWHRANDTLSPQEIASRVLEIFELGLAPR